MIAQLQKLRLATHNFTEVAKHYGVVVRRNVKEFPHLASFLFSRSDRESGELFAIQALPERRVKFEGHCDVGRSCLIVVSEFTL